MKHYKLAILCMCFGALAGISIKYPIRGEALSPVMEKCVTLRNVDTIKVGISGKVYDIKCKIERVDRHDKN